MSSLIQSIAAMQQAAASLRSKGKRIGLVPTMGSLHEGHLSLILGIREKVDFVITSVFVNPRQFGPEEDFERYPRNLERDCSLAFGAGADAVFAPTAEEMYPDGFQTSIEVGRVGEPLEGTVRPGHFQGVATVVLKLLIITSPHVAIFGRKDAQQLAVVRSLVRDLNLDVEIIGAPIVREADGLAMSSRNVYLTTEQRAEAAVLYRSLRLAESRVMEGSRDPAEIIEAMRREIHEKSSGEIDYISIAHEHTLEELESLSSGDKVLVSLAVRFGTTRLIDNCNLVVQ